ncbi:MAG: DUF3152 domain-containing protein [Mycobacteriaceae bacterium]
MRRRSGLGRFVAAYRWRAYAVPLLVVLTVLAVFDATRSSGGVPEENRTQSTAQGTAVSRGAASTPTSDFGSLATGRAGPGIIDESPSGAGSLTPPPATGALPAGGQFPTTGAGTWHVVPGTTPRVGAGQVSTSTYTVEVEDGMDTASFGGDEAFARIVDETLDNPKSWTADKRFALQRVDTGTPTFRISLTSQATVRPDSQCGYSIELESSCFNGTDERVLLNAARWVRGALPFQGDIGSYRQYLVNHEVGHAIGFRMHQPCASAGGLAPIMMQQTFSTSNDDIASLEPGGVVPRNGLSCHYNPWPFPRG